MRCRKKFILLCGEGWIQRLIRLNFLSEQSVSSWTDERTGRVFAKNIYRVTLREGEGSLSCYISKWMIMTSQGGNTSMESTEAAVGCLRAFTRKHDRICTRACVCVNTFVRLSPFACPTCKYTHRAHVGTHRVMCVSVHRRLHPRKLHVGMFRAVSVLPIIIIRTVASTAATQSTSTITVRSGKRKQSRLTEPRWRERDLIFLSIASGPSSIRRNLTRSITPEQALI